MRRRISPSRPGQDPRPDWRSYDLVAELYDRVRAPIHAVPAADLVALAAPPAGGRVLDVGTGTGVAAEVAARAVAPDGLVVGIDPSIEMLRRAAERGVEALVRGQALDLPFPDATFDVVLAAFVVPFFRKYQTALFDMRRTLKLGGRLAVATWSGREDEFRRTWREIAESFVGRDLLRDAMRQAAPWEELFSDPKRLKDVLDEAGFRQMRIEERDYRFTVPRDDYIAGRESSVSGRFLHNMLGDTLWPRFQERVREAFSGYPDPLGDTEDVLFAIGTKER
ncbi:MAG TPA: methyltransferase domain-containing protein [Actinomycetota bacterium]|nr:methyltransferase domain-containing protein [Actinomycetota bacterium]